MRFNDKRILVPVDGSEPAYRALALAVEVARGTGAIIDIVSVADTRHTELYDGYYMIGPKYEEITIEALTGVLKEAESRLPSDSPAHRTRLLRGAVSEVLLHEAAEEDVAAIVMGRTGKGFFGRMLEGSVSRTLAIHSPVPVMVAP